MSAESRAEVTWNGSLTQGAGRLRLTSGVAPELPVTWASRTARSAGKTSPEELLAGAHAACFAMGLSHGLSEAGTPPERLDVVATVTFAETDAGLGVRGSHLEVRGVVPGLDQAGFAAAAAAARDGCPISRALKGNIELSVAATLEPA
jgi:osmotically inducible protein OsmC